MQHLSKGQWPLLQELYIGEVVSDSPMACVKWLVAGSWPLLQRLHVSFGDLNAEGMCSLFMNCHPVLDALQLNIDNSLVHFPDTLLEKYWCYSKVDCQKLCSRHWPNLQSVMLGFDHGRYRIEIEASI